MVQIETLRFLTAEQTRDIAKQYGTPVFAYDCASLSRMARNALAFPNAYGLTVRYAMKANSNAAILQLFDRAGLHIDASSGYEASRAMMAGIAAEKILLTAQDMPANFDQLVRDGVLFNATSLNQLERFGKRFGGADVTIRINPGLGSGGTNRTNTGGPAASFGIWREAVDDVFALAKQYDLHITRLHTHIGSGSDPVAWQKIAIMCLDFVKLFDEVDTLSVGGGYKVGRMLDEESTDLQTVGAPVCRAIEDFYQATGRKIKLEIEPGTYLMANGGSLIATVQDITATGKGGYKFLKLDAGMPYILRPAMYGAQHPIVVVPQQERAGAAGQYVVAGPCCESGDILSPEPGDPESLQPRTLTSASVGDLAVIEGAGAYCASMCTKNYNSFPEAAEVFIMADGGTTLIRKRQTLEQITQNEVPLTFEP